MLTQQEAAQKIIERRKARRSFLSFCETVLSDQDKRPAIHHRYLIGKLQDVADGKISRLMVFMPPGSAKTTYVSKLFPAWLMQYWDAPPILGASHTAPLAEDISGGLNFSIQTIIKEYGYILGYNLLNESKERWYVSNGGVYLAAGVGAAIPGFRAKCAIIDDPIKSREDADSEAGRKRVLDWYNGSLERRIVPNAAIVLMHCMTGDTLVLMENGSQRRLDMVRSGDRVATMDRSRIAISTVKKWRNCGSDKVFEIRTKSGILAKANERHPFLIDRGGVCEWVKLRDLRLGDQIIRLAPGKGLGKALCALGRVVTSQLDHWVSVFRTTIKLAGRADIARRPSILNRIVERICVIGMGLVGKITNVFLRNKMESAPSVVAIASEMELRNISASIIITKPAKLGGYFAIIAIWLSKRGKQKKTYLEQLNTLNIIHDRITSIKYYGREDVFDIEIENTGNFIANGLVSHNTRWHEADLAGVLLSTEPEKWDVVIIPAEAEENDCLGRQPGEFLWSDDGYGYGELLRKTRDDLQQRGAMREWQSQYQQRPRPYEGALFKVGMIPILPAAPAGGVVCRAWDLASTEKRQDRRDPDWTRGVKLRHLPDGRYIVEDVRSIRAGPDEVKQTVVNTAQQDGKSVRVGLWQDPGQAGKAQVVDFTQALRGYIIEAQPVTGDKETYARPVCSQCNVGNLYLVEGQWNKEFLDELAGFPFAAHDDQVDALSRAFEVVGLSIDMGFWGNISPALMRG